MNYNSDDLKSQSGLSQTSRWRQWLRKAWGFIKRCFRSIVVNESMDSDDHPRRRATEGGQEDDGVSLGEVIELAGRPSTPEVQHYGGDKVECSVYAPPEAPPGSDFLVQVWLHGPENAAAVATSAKEMDEATRRRGWQSLREDFHPGDAIGLYFSMPGLSVVQPNLQELRWRGDKDLRTFAVSVPTNYSAAHCIGIVTVIRNSVPIGDIRFKVVISASARDGSGSVGTDVPSHPLPTGDGVRRYGKAFISYCRRDQIETVKRVQMLSMVRLDYFQDIFSLRSGERWEERLFREIESCDVFFLFWSSSAKESTWVLREVRYALDLRKRRTAAGDQAPLPEIIPVLLEGPPPPSPPDELNEIHFDDKFTYFFRNDPKNLPT